MIGALWTGISGLSSHQKALDNESNNIANVNTVGYKSSRISFADQMYQSKIGKGSIVQDAEKLYVQGNTKITGVEYDMMLEGDGFFTVVNKNTLGTAESFYTRAGNFRMGDNGTLQDAGGNEVQGWIMAPIDATKDVTSTNPNTSVFTDEYNKMLGSKIVRHGTYIETITAKATDYNLTAKTDSTIFSGDGAKSKSAKVADIENAIKDYNAWLQKLKEEPDVSSANSLAQVSQIDFKSGTDSIIGKDGDRIYAVIDGQTISTNFIVTNSTQAFRQDLWNGLSAAERIAEGLADPTTGTPVGSDLTASDIAAYDRAAGKIETYKALADLISNRLPVEATMAIDAGESGAFNVNTNYKSSTYLKDMLKGIIQIKSLIPGQEFKITEVAEQSGTKIAQGNYQSTAIATKGSGTAALETSKEALSRLISGKQQDVYTPAQLGVGISAGMEYSITIYDKELGVNVPIPNNNGKPPVANPVIIAPTPGASSLSVDDIVEQLNANNDLNKYVEARNVNGNLVVQTKNDNYDVEFIGNLNKLPGLAIDTTELTAGTNTYSITLKDGTVASLSVDSGNPADPATFKTNLATAITAHNTTNAANPDRLIDPMSVNGDFVQIVPTGVLNEIVEADKNYSGREGAGAEFLEIVTKVDQTASKGSIQLRLDTLNISGSPFGEFSVDNTGLITMKQDGAEFAIGQVAIARFNNNRGLNPEGNNLYGKTTESGDPIYNINNNKTAEVRGKALELSNADLSESLVNLMIFQRAFEANAKSITTSDELLNTLINLKR